jgi:hypothetical protein
MVGFAAGRLADIKGRDFFLGIDGIQNRRGEGAAADKNKHAALEMKNQMESIRIDGMTLFFEAVDRDAAELIGQARTESAQLLRRHWGLNAAPDCRICVMTSWSSFMFRSAPWPWKALLVLTLPFWMPRARAMWPIAGGWEQTFGRRRVLGIKPPRLIRLADSSIGDQIMILGWEVRRQGDHLLNNSRFLAVLEFRRRNPRGYCLFPGWSALRRH